MTVANLVWLRESLYSLTLDSLRALGTPVTFAGASKAIERSREPAVAQIGGTSTELVYYPITPCRYIDTRVVGGPLLTGSRLFNLTLTRCVKALLEHFPAETLQPGDVLVTNDPWLCAGHLFDIALVTPVFHQGRVVALMGTVGHVSDIGGVKDPLAAREIYDEGLQIPPMKLYEAGRPDRSLFRLMAQNIRNSDQVLGDVEVPGWEAES